MTHRTQSSLMPLVLVVGLLLVPMFSGCATMGAVDASSGKAKNVILLIGDGMGPSHFGATWLYSNRVLGKDLRMSEAMKAGRTAYLVNDTADAIVTESAAAAGQIATGQRMTARAVSMAADGTTAVKTVMETLKSRGSQRVWSPPRGSPMPRRRRSRRTSRTEATRCRWRSRS